MARRMPKLRGKRGSQAAPLVTLSTSGGLVRVLEGGWCVSVVWRLIRAVVAVSDVNTTRDEWRGEMSIVGVNWSHSMSVW